MSWTRDPRERDRQRQRERDRDTERDTREIKREGGRGRESEGEIVREIPI